MDFTLDSSLRDLERWAADNVRRGTGTTSQMLRASALEFLKGVIQRTPVDTGRARAGWTAWLDANGLPVDVGGSGEGVQQGKSEGTFREDLSGDQQYIEVVNGVPYIVALEFGHSQQSTAAVRVTIQRLVQRLDFIAQQELEKQIRAADRKAGFR